MKAGNRQRRAGRGRAEGMPHRHGMLVASGLARERGQGLFLVSLAGDGVGGAASLVFTQRQAPAGAFREKCCHRNKAAGRTAGAGPPPRRRCWHGWGGRGGPPGQPGDRHLCQKQAKTAGSGSKASALDTPRQSAAPLGSCTTRATRTERARARGRRVCEQRIDHEDTRPSIDPQPPSG